MYTNNNYNLYLPLTVAGARKILIKNGIPNPTDTQILALCRLGIIITK